MLIFILCIHIFCVLFTGYWFVETIHKDWNIKRALWAGVLLCLFIESLIDVIKTLGEM